MRALATWSGALAGLLLILIGSLLLDGLLLTFPFSLVFVLAFLHVWAVVL